jgi:dolichyl-phosphate-mannose--protein O-mannosyl transferase
MLSPVTDHGPDRGSDAVPAEARSSNKWSRVDVIAIVLVMVVAAIVRLTGLAHPDELVFDETYYAKDACWYVNASEATCKRASDAPEVHPPLGKWLIAVGIRVFGFDCPDEPRNVCEGTTTSFAWRIIPAVAGIATIGLLFLLARRLFRSTLAATMSSGLLALDFLHLVQSRTSMLDIFIPLFGVAAFYFLVLDRDQMAEGESEGSIWNRPHRLAAGAFLGAAVATKWSGGLLLLAGLALTATWAVAALRARPLGERIFVAVKREGPTVAVFLLLVPFLVYSLSYLGRVQNPRYTGVPWAQGHVVRTLWDHHEYMLGFHRDLESTHSYSSPGSTWLVLKRPVSYYFCSGDTCSPPNDGEYEEILATGSPFVWWPALLALLYVGYKWVRRRNFRGPEGVILAGFLFTYVPWLLIDRPAVFLFYLLPTIPFMCLAIGYVVTKIGESWEATAAIGLFSLATFGLFLFYYPVLVGRPLPQEKWDARIWVFDDCDKPVGATVTATSTETVGRRVTTRETTSIEDTSGLPPTGWCWI